MAPGSIEDNTTIAQDFLIPSGQPNHVTSEASEASPRKPPIAARCIILNAVEEEGILTPYFKTEDHYYLAKLEFLWKLKRGALQTAQNDPRNLIRLSPIMKNFFLKGHFLLVPDRNVVKKLEKQLKPPLRRSEFFPTPTNDTFEYTLVPHQEMQDVEIQHIDDSSNNGTGSVPCPITHKYPFKDLRVRANLHPFYAISHLGLTTRDGMIRLSCMHACVERETRFNFSFARGLELSWDLMDPSWRKFAEFLDKPFELGRIREVCPRLRKREKDMTVENMKHAKKHKRSNIEMIKE